MTEPRWSAGDCARAADVSRDLIASWADRHVISDVEPVGIGATRFFSYAQVVQAAIAVELGRLDVGPRDAASIARAFTHPKDRPACALHPHAKTLLVMQANSLVGTVTTWPEVAPSIFTDDCRSIAVVDLGAIVRKANAELHLPVPAEAWH